MFGYQDLRTLSDVSDREDNRFISVFYNNTWGLSGEFYEYNKE